MKKIIITLGVVLVAALVVCFAPIKTIAYTAFVDKQETETYYEAIPYEARETYTEQEPYQEEETYYDYEPFSFDVVDTFINTDTYYSGGVRGIERRAEYEYPIFCVELENTGTSQCIFEVIFDIYAIEKRIYEAENLADDEKYFKLIGDEYSGFESLIIDPDTQETVTYSVSEINMDFEEILWEYDIFRGGQGRQEG